jgi:organic radical activating enzyme
MINYNLTNIHEKLSKNSNVFVLYGAGDIGELAMYALEKLNIKVSYFCDSNKDKNGTKYFDVTVLSPDELYKLDRNINIFISNNYISVLKNQLKEKNFFNIFDCNEILQNTIFPLDKKYLNLHPQNIDRRIAFYKNMCLKDAYLSNDRLVLKSIDIQITERCSLKCVNCSNLMQYYKNPKHSEMDLMFESIDRFMNSIDEIYEFRILGGDPFIHKELYKVVNKLKLYSKVHKIVVYTNGKIIPKGENLECLKDKRVIVNCSNYGEVSNKHDEIVKVLEANNVIYATTRTDKWQDCGRILPYQERTEEENKHLFNFCCNSDLISLLHGKLYRCPFSANAVNIKAIPDDKDNFVDLLDKSLSIENLRKKIKYLTFEKKFLTACSYCNGRDYRTDPIPAAEQSKKPLEYKKIE